MTSSARPRLKTPAAARESAELVNISERAVQPCSLVGLVRPSTAPISENQPPPRPASFPGSALQLGPGTGLKTDNAKRWKQTMRQVTVVHVVRNTKGRFTYANKWDMSVYNCNVPHCLASCLVQIVAVASKYNSA